MELDKRKLKILQALIDDYILTAAPVGSRTLSKRAEFNVSPATIRNEMSDLEELGYLDQPHTSAGRIPSNKAYRLYVNHMMQRAQLNENERKAIRAYVHTRINQAEGLVRQTAMALSEITRYAAFALPPQYNTAKIKHMQAVQLSNERALLVLVTDTGLIRDVMLRLPEGITAQDLERFSVLLNKRLLNKRLDQLAVDQIIDIGEDLGEQRMFLQETLEIIERQLAAEQQKVQLSGTTNLLFQPEYSDADKAKAFLAALEGKDTLYHTLKKVSTLELSITIGEENDAQELKDCSIVTATYKIGRDPVGTFGILGPTRMNYSRVLAILEYMQLSLSETLIGMIEQDGRN